MNIGIFTAGAVVLIVGSMILVNDLPQKQALDEQYGLQAHTVTKYDKLSFEILIGYTLVGTGAAIIIPGIFLKQK